MLIGRPWKLYGGGGHRISFIERVPAVQVAACNTFQIPSRVAEIVPTFTQLFGKTTIIL